jgi:effector-binding domain-containing protein
MNEAIELVQSKAQAGLSIRQMVKFAEIPNMMSKAYGELMTYMQRNDIQMVGPPFVFYHSWSDVETDMDCGFPVTSTFKGEGRIHSFDLPAVKVMMTIHTGPYEKLGETYKKVEEKMRAMGIKPADHMWESYLNNPMEVPPEKLLTQIFWPIE